MSEKTKEQIAEENETRRLLEEYKHQGYIKYSTHVWTLCLAVAILAVVMIFMSIQTGSLQYKQGQIDYALGNIKWVLMPTSDGTTQWKEVAKLDQVEQKLLVEMVAKKNRESDEIALKELKDLNVSLSRVIEIEKKNLKDLQEINAAFTKK